MLGSLESAFRVWVEVCLTLMRPSAPSLEPGGVACQQAPRGHHLPVLLFRPDDLALLRAEPSGFNLDNEELSPSADAATTLDFPPQALGEIVLDPVTGRAATSLAGTSRITVKGLAAGVRAPFTVAGITPRQGVLSSHRGLMAQYVSMLSWRYWTCSGFRSH